MLKGGRRGGVSNAERKLPHAYLNGTDAFAVSDAKRLFQEASEGRFGQEAEAVSEESSDTDEALESGIAPEVLAKLLPDSETIFLPRLIDVGGSVAYRVAKRIFDIIACTAALAILAFPMVIIALKIRQESPGPAIYAQNRVGCDGKVFKLYKFRSMRVDAEALGAQWATEGDPRVTSFGRFLRKSRLDEIPQFWNVLKGDMSLIGPRPERPAFHEEFCKRIDGWEQRLAVRPGITGLAQVRGGYELLPREKILYDLDYIENRSLKMDWSIVWQTLRVMVSGDGAR